MLPQPVHGFPAIIVHTNKERLLAICDLHLGIEEKYRRAGAPIQPVTGETADRIIQIINNHAIDRLVVLGDTKHNIPWTTLMESREVPVFFGMLAEQVKRFELIIGNHDARLKELFTKEQRIDWNIRFHDQCFTLGDFAFIHGHKWPPEKVFAKKFILMAHNHPTVELPQGIRGVSIFQQCWVRSGIIRKNVLDRFPDIDPPKDQEIIVMPSVLGDTRGTSFNSKNTRLLGPVLTNKLMDIINARIYLLDGTDMGTIKDLRTD